MWILACRDFCFGCFFQAIHELIFGELVFFELSEEIRELGAERLERDQRITRATRLDVRRHDDHAVFKKLNDLKCAQATLGDKPNSDAVENIFSNVFGFVQKFQKC